MKLLIINILLLLPILMFGQRVDGHISEKNSKGENTSLIGANVFWLGTTVGTTTNPDGYFVINRPSGANRLVVSFVGYDTDTLSVPLSKTHVMHTMSASITIEGVVVSGSVPGTHFDRLNPIQSQVITRNELNRAACCNLSESFETNASVDVSYSDAVTGAKQIQLLGLAGSYSQIQIENIPALRGLSSTYGLGHVPGSWMESISISKGTASVANGYESISGQINVEYKKPWEDEYFYINGYGNSLGMAEFNTNFSFNVTPKVSTMVLAHVENMSFDVDHNHDSFLDHPLNEQYHVLNRWKYQGDKFESQFGIRLLDENRKAGQVSSDHITNPFGIEVKTRQYEGFGKTGYIFDRPTTSLGLIISASKHEQQSMFGQTIYNGNQQSFYSNLVFITYIGKTNHTIKTGLSFTNDNIDERLDATLLNREETVPGIYAEYTYKWLDKVTVLSGLRFDNHNVFGSFFTPRVHLNYNPSEQFCFKASAGKGYRSPSIIAENIHLLASSKGLFFNEEIRMEEAWNFGFNFIQRYRLLGRELTISTDYYRTEFINQLIVDMDQSPGEVYFYNLNGKSYSNNFQIETSYKLMERLDLTMAYRWNDVKTTINNELVEKPLMSRYKGFVSTSYKTPQRKWQFDYTIHLNGGGRLPSTDHLDIELQKGERFPSYLTMNAQVSRSFNKWDTYIGVENLSGFTQKNPIILASNPNDPFFDASTVWGPITGQKFYFGFRYSLTR
jgi:outer membrane receptor for ferrienterochelin and colicins